MNWSQDRCCTGRLDPSVVARFSCGPVFSDVSVPPLLRQVVRVVLLFGTNRHQAHCTTSSSIHSDITTTTTIINNNRIRPLPAHSGRPVLAGLWDVWGFCVWVLVCCSAPAARRGGGAARCMVQPVEPRPPGECGHMAALAGMSSVWSMNLCLSLSPRLVKVT